MIRRLDFLNLSNRVGRQTMMEESKTMKLIKHNTHIPHENKSESSKKGKIETIRIKTLIIITKATAQSSRKGENNQTESHPLKVKLNQPRQALYDQ